MNHEVDSRKFGVILYWLAEKFPKGNETRVLSDEEISDYFQALKDLHIDRIGWAAKRYYATAQYPRFPLPGELRSLVDQSPANVVQIARTPLKELPQFSEGYHENTAKGFEGFMKVLDELGAKDLVSEMDVNQVLKVKGGNKR